MYKNKVKKNNFIFEKYHILQKTKIILCKLKYCVDINYLKNLVKFDIM